jgi:hypothetical protein
MKADNYFAVVPEWVIDHEEISDGAFRLYAVLRRYADKGGKAWPSIGTLSDRMHKGERQVRRLMRELEEAGAVRVHPRYEGGQQGSNLYMVVSHRTQMSMGGVTDDSPTPDTGDSQNQSQENQSQTEEGVKRDMLFESVAEVWMGSYNADTITRSERGRINRALTELRRIGATPSEVITRGRVWVKKWPETPASPQALVRNWNALVPRESRHAHEWTMLDEDGTITYTCECGERKAIEV